MYFSQSVNFLYFNQTFRIQHIYNIDKLEHSDSCHGLTQQHVAHVQVGLPHGEPAAQQVDGGAAQRRVRGQARAAGRQQQVRQRQRRQPAEVVGRAQREPCVRPRLHRLH